MKIYMVRRNAVALQRRYRSISYLTSAIKREEQKQTPPVEVTRKQAKLSNKQIRDNVEGLPISTKALEREFWLEGEAVFTQKDMSQAQAFFNAAEVALDWTIGSYQEIPDVKYEKLDCKRRRTLENVDIFNKTEYHENLANSRKSFGIAAGLLKPLPEILLLGNTNAGKSTLINNLLVKKNANKIADYAYVSRRAGFTKTLNCFNIGGKLRLVDSPGYGEFGKEAQGSLVLDYISNRDRLAGALILIDSEFGIREDDISILSHLHENDIKHDVIFTKVDSIIKRFYSRTPLPKDASELKSFVEISKSINEGIIEYYGEHINRLPFSQRIFFSNSLTNKYTKVLSGYKQIRAAILQDCKEFEIEERV